MAPCRVSEHRRVELMESFVALLRAVNVGGTGRLAMSDLRALAEAAGLRAVRTVLASGNLLFESDLDEAGIGRLLEQRLQTQAGAPVGVLIRTRTEMAGVLARNPFAEAAPNHVMAIFLDRPAPHEALQGATGQTNEALQPGLREIYVHYPNGMANSMLRISAARTGTARNMNTVARLV